MRLRREVSSSVYRLVLKLLGAAGATVLVLKYQALRVAQSGQTGNSSAYLPLVMRDSEYDNVGYRLRGRQYADAQGDYRLETVLPGLYTGRTMHIHVKVSQPGGRVLTTQIYFNGVAPNQSDRIFTPSLATTLTDAPDGSKQATFDFVL